MGIEAAFLGTLGKDAEPKTSGAGKPYLRANVRVGDGERAQWVNVTAFDADAIATADKFVKGAAVYIEGRLSLDKWTDHGGASRSGLSCMSWHCRLAQIDVSVKDVATREAAIVPRLGRPDFRSGCPVVGVKLPSWSLARSGS